MVADTVHYILRFPFRLPPGQELSDLGEGQERECDSLSVKLRELSGWYYFVIEPFPDEASAQAFIPKVYAGLMWALLHRGLSPEASLQPQRISYTADPVETARHLFKTMNLQVDRVDSMIDATSPALFLSDKKIRVATAGHVTLTQGFNPEQTLGLLCEAMTFPNADRVALDGKIRIAFELYNSFFREASENARFLTLAMALEALAPEERKPVHIVRLLEKWMSTVRDRKAVLQSDSEDWANYDSLEREIGFRRNVSIRKRIRTLVQTTLALHGDRDADETARAVVSIYDKRGRLIHDGYLPEQELREATTQLRTIVGRVLEARFVQLAGRSPDT
jgi:hypothetical protein